MWIVLLQFLSLASVYSFLVLDAHANSGGSSAGGYSRNEVGDFNSGESAPQSVESYELAAEYAIKHKNFLLGIKWLEEGLQKHPDDLSYRESLCKAHIAYGDHLCKQQKIEGAIVEYEKALDLDKSSLEAASKLKSLKTKPANPQS